MVDYKGLLVNTGAYKIFESDFIKGKLSHAYLLLHSDGLALQEFLKIFSALIVCENKTACLGCRKCNLVLSGVHADVLSYPKDKKGLVVADVNSIIEESVIKPIESNKKIFLIFGAENMNATSQNKLLKTLEEPPENVVILMGATSDSPLLPTIKSRVKRLEIGAFSQESLYSAIQDGSFDEESLKNAINCSNGTVSDAIFNYESRDMSSVYSFAVETINSMQSSRDVLTFVSSFFAKKMDVDIFLSALAVIFRDMLVALEGKENLVKNKDVYNKVKDAKGYTRGALINAIEKINQAENRKKFNANGQMLVEWLFFQILEGKYKWQK